MSVHLLFSPPSCYFFSRRILIHRNVFRIVRAAPAHTQRDYTVEMLGLNAQIRARIYAGLVYISIPNRPYFRLVLSLSTSLADAILAL